MATYPIKFTYLESWALDLSPTQIIPTLSRLFFSSNSFLIVLQIDEWTPPHNPRSDVNATYSVWNEIKGYHFSYSNEQRSFRIPVYNNVYSSHTETLPSGFITDMLSVLDIIAIFFNSATPPPANNFSSSTLWSASDRLLNTIGMIIDADKL